MSSKLFVVVMFAAACASSSTSTSGSSTHAGSSASIAPAAASSPKPLLVPRRTLEESLTVMTACYRGVNPEVRDLTNTDVYCSQIYRRPACAAAWLEMSHYFSAPQTADAPFDGRSRVATVVDACRAEYCVADAHVSTLDTPALCSPKTDLTKETIIELVAWLLDQELELPTEQSQKWARGAFFSYWLRSK